MARSVVVRIAVVALAAVLGAGLPAAPALADLEEPFDIVVSATFDKPSYLLRDPIGVRVTVRNAGPGPARGVRANPTPGNVVYGHPQWGDLKPIDGPGVDLEPGQAIEINLSGHVSLDAGAELKAHLELSVFSTVSPEPNTENNKVTIEAPLTVPRGNCRGIVFGDGNGNGDLDSGEELRGVSVRLTGGDPRADYLQTTDAQGLFVFTNIPTGKYYAIFDAPGPWGFDPVESIYLTVDTEEHPLALIRATHFLQSLTASVRFTKSTYVVDEPAHLTIVLTNSGTTELTGITALCTGPGDGYEIYSAGPGWDEIAYEGLGITLRAGETRTFDEWSPVPLLARSYGFVSADCLFGSPPEMEGNPRAVATARVHGGVGGVGSRLVYDRDSDGHYDGDGVAGATVALVDPDTHAVVARKVTGADGKFLFTDVPANKYELRVIGPWKLVEGEVSLQVRDGHVETGLVFVVLVVPGPRPPDPDTPTQTPGVPAPQGGVTPRVLASTGANVIGLSIWGLLAVLTGFGLLLAGRRRSNPSAPA